VWREIKEGYMYTYIVHIDTAFFFISADLKNHPRVATSFPVAIRVRGMFYRADYGKRVRACERATVQSYCGKFTDDKLFATNNDVWVSINISIRRGSGGGGGGGGGGAAAEQRWHGIYIPAPPGMTRYCANCADIYIYIYDK